MVVRPPQPSAVTSGRHNAGSTPSFGAGWTWQLRDGALEKITYTDTRGRLGGVWDGRSGALVRTARYRMDGRGRVTEFVDADDNVYDYKYDGAGRLREVGRKSSRARTSGLPPGVTSAPDLRTRAVWYTFDYDGPRPSDMYENKYGTLLWVAGWTYDAIGRPVTKYVLADRQTSSTELYEWEWDTDWIGAIAVQSDPHGTTTYEYDGDLYGSQGHVSAKERTWTDTGAPTARFEYDYDFDGTVVATRWPSGAEVVADLAPNTRWLEGHTVYTGSEAVPIEYNYGEWGEQTGFTAPGEGDTEFALDVTWATPERIADLDWTTIDGSVETTRSISYGYRPWGDIEWKDVSGSGHYEYWYGNDTRMYAITKLVGGTSVELERYYYSILGDLTKVRRSDEGTWAYSLDAFSQGWKRTSQTTGEQQKATWDHAGRMATWLKVGSPSHLWTFGYDGAGRLNKAVHTTGSTTVLDSRYGYDVADQLVWEKAGVAKTWRFDGWHKDPADVIEKLLPMVSLVDGDLQWTFLESDGHALEVYDNDGDQMSFEVLGHFGMPLSGTAAAQRQLHLPTTTTTLPHSGL